jgi:endonuclease/exonuclease/phosphatase family metal-dependent hydrolase
MPDPILTVATLNLLNDLTHWPERAPLIVNEFRAVRPDLIALQEVSLPLNNAQWLADQLGGYSVYLSPKTGRKSKREALAILSRMPVEDHTTLPLIDQDRVAQRVVVRHHGEPWTFANTHLYWNPFNDVARRRQAGRILEWIAHDRPAIVCGDFNAEPHYPSIATMRRRFASAHVEAHGREPDYTCPTPLHRGPEPNHSARRAALRLVGLVVRRRNVIWRGTIDYIFVDRRVRVQHCAIAFDTPAPHNQLIYPSDHLGLTATLEMT